MANFVFASQMSFRSVRSVSMSLFHKDRSLFHNAHFEFIKGNGKMLLTFGKWSVFERHFHRNIETLETTLDFPKVPSVERGIGN